MASRLGENGDVRVTFIDTEGTVLADSDADASTVEDHAAREEVREALQGEVGSAERESETTGQAYLYTALPARGGLIVRLALPLDEVQNRLDRSRLAMFLVGLAVAAVGLLVVWLVARRLAAPIESLTASVDRIAEGDLETRVPAEPCRRGGATGVSLQPYGGTTRGAAGGSQPGAGATGSGAGDARQRRGPHRAGRRSGIRQQGGSGPDRPNTRDARPNGPPPTPGADAGGAGVGGARCRRDPATAAPSRRSR